MSDETTTEQLAEIEGQADTVQVREGRWRTRGGEVKNIRPCEPLRGAYYIWPWTDGFMTYQDNGRNVCSEDSVNDLVEYLGPLEPQPEPETQAADTAATEYTPPEGWRLLAVGEVLQDGDKVVNLSNGKERPTIRPGRCVENNQSYIRLIKSEPQVAAIEELRSEVAYVQNLLGESRQRVTQLEELVGSLRTINEATEKTVRLAGQENTDLQHRLNVVSAELAEQAATCNGLRAHVEAVEADLVQQRLERNRYQNQVLRLTAELDNKTTECRNLRIELDALQQAPQAETMAATPPATEDRFEQGWDAGTARAVETIAEWTEPFRTCGSQGLSYHVMQNLPHIMRTLTGLTSED